MQQFSVSRDDGEHLGFLIMLPDDEQTNQSGQLAVRLAQGANAPKLQTWADEGTLFWAIVGDKVQVRDSDNVLRGSIQQQWLNIGGEHFVLNDLLGTM